MKYSRFIASAGVAVALLTGASAFAQEGVTNTQTASEVVGQVGGPEIGDSAGFTVETVDPNQPLGGLNIEPTASRDAINARLTSAQRDELKGRCAVVMANEIRYETSIATFCISYVSEVPN
jgi:hypothetical protein